MQRSSLTSRFASLQQSALLAQRRGYVLLGGDFNAKVASLGPPQGLLGGF